MLDAPAQTTTTRVVANDAREGRSLTPTVCANFVAWCLVLDACARAGGLVDCRGSQCQFVYCAWLRVSKLAGWSEGGDCGCVSTRARVRQIIGVKHARVERARFVSVRPFRSFGLCVVEHTFCTQNARARAHPLRTHTWVVGG